MPKYLVSYTETNIYSIEMEADSEKEAEAKAIEEVQDSGTDNFRHIDQENFFQVEGEV